MSETSKSPDLSVEEYLKFEETSTVRNEYIAGQIFAMSGSTEAHNFICSNLHALIHMHLRPTGCRAFMSDMKVRVEVSNCFYYPDIMVTCEAFEAKSTFKNAPVLIAEVQSPSTKHIDCREKLVAYRQLESLREYLIVSQDRQKIELYRKGLDGQWERTLLGSSDSLLLKSLSGTFEIPVSAVYEKVELTPIVEEREEEYIYTIAK